MVIPTKSGSCRCSKATAKRKRGRRVVPPTTPILYTLLSTLLSAILFSAMIRFVLSLWVCVCVFLHFALDMSLCVCQKKEPKDTDWAWVPSACLSVLVCVSVCVCLQLTYGFFSVFGFVNFTWNILLELSYIVACPNLPAWQRLHLSKFPHCLQVMDTLPLPSSFPHSPSAFYSSYPLLHTHKQSRSQAVCKLTLSRLIEVLLTA